MNLPVVGLLLGLLRYAPLSGGARYWGVWSRRRKVLVALLVVLACGLWGAWPNLGMLAEMRGQDLRNPPSDADNHYFVMAWQKTPDFAATLKWWHGPWGQEYRPFFRPLPSLFFYTQYRLFGLNSLQQFTALLLVWHFVALVVAWRFFTELLGLKMGTFSVALWAIGFARNLVLPVPQDALYAWKDNVETWHAIPHLLCLLGFLRWLRQGERRHFYAALAWFLVALCTKELAYTAPFLLALLLWHEGKLSNGQWRTQWRCLVPFLALAAVLFCYRFVVLGYSMGFRMGSNRSWPRRWLADFGGMPGAYWGRGEFLMLSLIAFSMLLLYAVRGQKRRAACWGALGVAGLCFTSFNSNIALVDTLCRLLVPEEYPNLPYMALLMFLWGRFFASIRRREKTQLFGFAWAFLTYLPLLSGANTAHIFYFISLGWGVWFACAWRDLALLADGARLKLAAKLAPNAAAAPPV